MRITRKTAEDKHFCLLMDVQRRHLSVSGLLHKENNSNRDSLRQNMYTFTFRGLKNINLVSSAEDGLLEHVEQDLELKSLNLQ